MAHFLTNRHELNAVGMKPLTLSARYQCECTGKEVITIQALIDLDCPEEQFLWTMKRLRDDIRFEVRQHLKPVGKPDALAR